jgi:flagellar hook protein FlgE
MDTLSNNISNVNTTGYKASRANFQDGLNQILRGGGAGRNPMQAGTGITVGSIGTKMEQGPLQATGRILDLAIQGTGFFCVKQVGPDGSELDPPLYTRDGAFFIDSEKYIVNSSGYRLQGGGSSIQLAGDSLTSISVDKKGGITYYTTDDPGNPKSASITITTFPNQEGLEKAGNNLYKESSSSGAASGDIIPGDSGSGTIESGFLEMSNTDLSEEFTTMITTQRGYQASARIVTVSDTLLEELIQLKR